MAIPIANFTFITNGLTIFLQDTSTESPNAWQWDFGDSVGTSIIQNPTYSYAAAGSYTISLIATNGDGSSTPYTYEITVNSSNTVSIDDIIEFEIPPSITLDQNTKNYLLLKWRLYLQAAFEIEDAYLMDEASYSQLQNILIAKLIIYDLLVLEAKRYLASTMNGGGSSSTGASGGNIKKIETGPSNVEWYSGSDTLSKIFGPDKNGVSPFDSLSGDVCGLGNKLGVKLPMCKLYQNNPVIPLKTDVIDYITSHDFLTNNYGQSN